MVEEIHYSTNLERAIIGACLLESTALGRAYGIVQAEHFHFEDHRKIFSSLLEMFDTARPIDLFTVSVYLTGKGVVLNSGNIGWYLCVCTNEVVSTAHLEYHSLLVADMWRMRELEKITNSGINPLEDIRSQIAEINAKVSALQTTTLKKDWLSAEELMEQLTQHQAKVIQTKHSPFITTGFKQVDLINGGFSGNQFIIVGARPSVGKTALLAKISREIARSGVGVGIISLETDNVRIAARLAAQDTSTSFQTIYRNLFLDDQARGAWFSKISNETAKLPIYVSDKTKVDINEIRAKAAKLAAIFERRKIKEWILALDYIQLVETTTNRNYNREQEISKISRGCKLLASELNKPLIALAQLSRESSKRTYKDRFPKLTDLRESGSLEQDADIVWMLHRDWAAGFEQNESGQSTEHEADLLSVKWRDGAPFKIKLNFDAETMTFSEPSGGLKIGWKQPVITNDEEEAPF